jgi:SAM-dependent methyltransferase
MPNGPDNPNVMHVRTFYDVIRAEEYLHCDSEALRSNLVSGYCEIVRDLAAGLDVNHTVLDLACGTSRYLHCVPPNVPVVGLDASLPMLHCAVSRSRTLATPAAFVCGDVCRLPFRPRTFQLIVSIGCLGEYSPFDVDLCRTLQKLLVVGGRTFFTVVDRDSRPLRPLKKLLRTAYPHLPPGVQNRLFPSIGVHRNYLRRSELEAVLSVSGFKRWTLTRFTGEAGWVGAHFGCLCDN